MKGKERLVYVYTGTAVTVNLLKDELEQIGISGLIRDDFNSGSIAGFTGGLPSAIDLYIQEFDLEKAKPVIDEFVRQNKD
jgi:hypothetical protein